MKKIGLIVISIAAVSMSGHAYANMQNAMNSMFTSNVTSAGSFKSATRSGFVGGGISLRTPVKPINLASFDPPRFSAGCGGIDMYAGSFSFINADQFTQLLRNIMNNAIGLLFQAALAVIDPMISNLVDKFQKIVQDLNSLASNTCAIANQAVDSIKSGSVVEDVRKAASAIGQEVGAISDYFTGNNPASPAKDKAQLKAQEDKNPNAGNFTWRALNRTQVGDTIGAISIQNDSSDPKKNKPKQFLMSLIGTAIATSNSTNPNASNVAADAATYGNIITLLDLLNRDNLEVWKCKGKPLNGDRDAFGKFSCVELEKVKLDMVNMYDYVKNMLYGDTTKKSAKEIQKALSNASPETPGVKSIYGKILNCQKDGCDFTKEEQNFLTLAGPVFNLIKDVQYDRVSIATITPYIEKRLAIMMTMKMGEAASTAARTSWNGVSDVTMPKNVNDRLFGIGREMNTLAQLLETTEDDLKKAKDISETIRKSFPALGAN